MFIPSDATLEQDVLQPLNPYPSAQHMSVCLSVTC